MPNIDLSILNQRQTPAFYADTLANRPAAGFVGRIFVSTNTFAFYRDNGTGWDIIGGPGTGTVTGTGANGQVTFWNGASTITGSNDLFWDSANGHFGVNTNVPGTALDVHHDQPTVAILNQTVATNDVRIGFQNNGVGLWRIGAFYNAGANDFGIYDAVAAIQPVTVKKTTGQVLIGTSTVGSGKLVVASATSDNGVQIVGASAPSLRIDNAESGPTKRAGFGISTAVNNFIQGSADRDFCMFNGSTTASPILFGIYDAGAGNVQEAARISPSRNFLIGTTVDSGDKLRVAGSAVISLNLQANQGNFLNAGVPAIYATRNLDVTIVGSAGQGIEFGAFSGATRISGAAIYGGLDNPATTGNLIFQTLNGGTLGTRLTIASTGAATFSNNVYLGGATSPVGSRNELRLNGNNVGSAITMGRNGNNVAILQVDSGDNLFFENTANTYTSFSTNNTERLKIFANGNILVGTGADSGQKFQVSGMLNAGLSCRAGTYTQGDTTPSVTGISHLNISNSSPTSITNFTGGIENQVIILYFNDSNTTITRNNAYLLGGLNFTSTAYDMLTLMYINGNWYETSRSINS